MLATFLIEVNLTDPSAASVLDEVNAIQDALDAGGIDYNSVKPWARDALAQTTPPILQVPPPYAPPTTPT